jgi:simple sugar transport system permease protein
VLGVLFINMMKNNLVLLGVSSSWQRAAVGVLLVLGITIQAISENRKSKRQKTAANKEKE